MGSDYSDTETTMTTQEGGCACGDVRYRTVGEPLLATVCYCKYCQKRTGSAFSEPVMFRVEQVEFSRTARTIYEHRSGESGRWLRMEFCPRCGTTVSWTAQRRPGMRGISSGTFDNPDWLKSRKHIWTRSVPQWMLIPEDAEQFEKGSQRNLNNACKSALRFTRAPFSHATF